MRKRILSIALCLCMAITLLPTAGAAEGDLEKMSFAGLPAGTSTFLDGDDIRVGVPESPDAPVYWTDDLTEAPDGYAEDGDTVTITTPEALAWLAVRVNGLNGQTADNFAGKTVVLGSDIDLAEGFTFSEDGGYTGEGTPRQWTPIGYLKKVGYSITGKAFCGVLDGGGHTIRGIYLDEGVKAEQDWATCGLFGYVDFSGDAVGMVKNVTIENSYLSSARYAIGSVAGVNTGTVENCHSSAFVHAQGNVGSPMGTGGLVGENNDCAAQILNCTFSGSVTSRPVTPYVGGIAGANTYGYVADCRNTGAVFSEDDKVGGIVGFNHVPNQGEDPMDDRSGIIERCVNAGSVTAAGTGDMYVGGICGMSSWNLSNDYVSAIRNCLNLGAVSGGEKGGVVGGVCGYLDNTTMENCYNAAPVSGQAQVGALVGKSYRPVSVVSHSYFLQTDEVNAELPAIAEPASDAPNIDYAAAVDAEKQASGEVAWLLNTASGTGDHSGVWAQVATPILADDGHKPTCKVTFRYEAGEPDVVYTRADGTAAIPDAAADKVLTANDVPFTAATVVTADTTVTAAAPKPGPVPDPSGGSDDDDGDRTTTTTEKHNDGSTTKTTTNKTTGTVTETTKRPDGSTTTVEMKKDGTITTREQDKAGNKIETVKKPDGSMTATETRTDGTKVETETTKDGRTTAEVTVPKGQYGTTVTIPTPEQPSAGVVAVIVHEDGTKEVVMNSLPGADGLTVTLDEGARLELVDNSKDFADLPANHWAAEAADFVTARELFAGTGADTFSPEVPATRAMLWTVLARLYGVDTSGGAVWYEKGREWAVEAGVSDGTDPEGVITREQLAVMLYRCADSPEVGGMALREFADGETVSAWACDALLWAVDRGILTGKGGGLLDPQGEAARAQVAVMLMRFLMAE